MPYIESIDEEHAVLRLSLLVVLDHLPLLQVRARDQAVQEVFLAFERARVYLLLFLQEITGYRLEAITGAAAPTSIDHGLGHRASLLVY